jgi:hypothetical protein
LGVLQTPPMGRLGVLVCLAYATSMTFIAFMSFT